MWVLVVDDSPSSIIFISEALRSLGHSVLTCPDAPTALETLRSVAIDVVLADYQMPGMNALEFIVALRTKNKSVTSPPVVMITSDTSTALVTAAKSHGAAAVLHKPLELERLAATMDAAASNSSR